MNIVEQLKRDEGVKPYVYKDTLGYDTIGVGFLVDGRKGGGLLPEEIDWILQNRLKVNTEKLQQALPWFKDLNEARQGVLLNMCWQLGFEGLMGFKNTLKYIENKDWVNAALNMSMSKWASQTPERARRLCKQMCEGTWQ